MAAAVVGDLVEGRMMYSDGGAAIYTAGVVDGVLALDGARDLAKGLPFARDFCCVARRRAWRAI